MRSVVGTPNKSDITVTGKGAANSSTILTSLYFPICCTSSFAIACIRGFHCSKLLGVNALETIERTLRCSGGSVELILIRVSKGGIENCLRSFYLKTGDSLIKHDLRPHTKIHSKHLALHHNVRGDYPHKLIPLIRIPQFLFRFQL